jgi:hypothetical protein
MAEGLVTRTLQSQNPWVKFTILLVLCPPGAALAGWAIGGSGDALGAGLTTLGLVCVGGLGAVWMRRHFANPS